MKKKVLFLCSNMRIGGFQKSLISLLKYFDYDKYEVDLLLFRPEGVFMSLIPEQVNLIAPPTTPDYLESIKIAIPRLWHQNRFGLMLWRAFSGMVSFFNKGIGAWLMSRAIPKLKEKKYDVVIDYNGQHILYYMMDKVSGGKKCTFFHSDYAKWKYYMLMDKIYYHKVDVIVSVSEECVNSLKRLFPREENKIFCVENIIADRTVNFFPKNSNTFTDQYAGIRIVTVGRVCVDKGIEYALDACHILKERGNMFRWYWVGPCNDFSLWKDKIKEYNIEEYFIFLGPTNNPYDYIRNAYLVVHPSKFEGKAVAVEEAKILAIPVIATNYSTVTNQIIDGINGSIVNMSAEAIAERIEYYLKHPEEREKQHEYMQQYCKGNEEEVNKLYKIIE